MNLSIYIYMENECQKIIVIWSISIGIFVSFQNIFCRLFNLVFTNNIHENSVGKTFLGYSYHLCGIICNPQRLASHASALTTELSGRTMRYASFWSWTFQNVSAKTKSDSPFPVP